MQRKHILGFSLIELMIVVTILGILAAFALPSYRDYVKRARFAEVMTATAPYKTAVALGLQKGVSLSELNLGTHGIPKAPKPNSNLESLVVNEGVITATATAAAGGYTFILSPKSDGSEWLTEGTCKAANMCSD